MIEQVVDLRCALVSNMNGVNDLLVTSECVAFCLLAVLAALDLINALLVLSVRREAVRRTTFLHSHYG